MVTVKVVPFQLRFQMRYSLCAHRLSASKCISGINEKISEKIVTQQLEQFGRAVGRLIINAKEHTLDDLGEQDRK